MRIFQDKRTRRILLFSHVTLVLLVIFIIVLLHAVRGIYQKKALVEDTRAGVEKEVSFLKERRGALQTDIARLSSDQGSEAELRSKFQISRPGEEVLVLVEEDAGQVHASSSPTIRTTSFFDVIKRILHL